MAIKFAIVSTFLLVLLAHVEGQGGAIDVTKFGAKPDADISKVRITAAHFLICQELPSFLFLVLNMRTRVSLKFSLLVIM